MGFILDILIGINLALLAYGLFKAFFKWIPRYLESKTKEVKQNVP